MNDDNEIWEELTKGIKKLGKKSRVSFSKQVKLKITPKISPDKIYNGNRLSDLEIGNFANIDANTAERFRKGEMPIEAELDLHGYNEERAFDAVVNFVKNSYLRKKRCIAIITGKGIHPSFQDDIFSTRGVLKDLVPQWLNNSDIRPLILSITHPANKDGGVGVIKILLRRQRAKETD